MAVPLAASLGDVGPSLQFLIPFSSAEKLRSDTPMYGAKPMYVAESRVRNVLDEEKPPATKHKPHPFRRAAQ